MIVTQRILYESEWSKLPTLRTRTDATICLLILLKSLILERLNKREDDSIICWYYPEINRIFWGNERKSIHSLCTPFSLDTTDKDIEPYSMFGRKAKYEYLDILLWLFWEIRDHKERFSSIEGMDDEFSDMLQQSNVSNQDDQDNLWYFFLCLCTFETGYLRYDYDPDNQNPIFHPLYHFDINYNKYGTYKIGLRKKLTIDEFADFLDSTTPCYYVEK